MLYFDRQRPDLVAGRASWITGRAPPCWPKANARSSTPTSTGSTAWCRMTRRPVSAMLAAFRQRDVYLINGTADIDPMADGLDRDCPGLLQGRFRLERGQRYYSTSVISSDRRSTRTSSWSWFPASRTPAARCSGARPANRSSSSMQTARRNSRPGRNPSAAKFTLVIHGGGGVRDRAEFAAKPGLEKPIATG